MIHKQIADNSLSEGSLWTARMLHAVALMLLASTFRVHADLVAVYSIQRHGARNFLPKTANLTENSSIGGPTLLPEGERQCYNAGVAFRARYIDRVSCGSTCLPVTSTDTGYGIVGNGTFAGAGFHNYNTYVRSSYTDRALLSAQSFMAGVFPANASVGSSNGRFIPTGQQMVPVYSHPDADDFLIRAYTKCPTYDQRLTDWFQSQVFLDKQTTSAALRSSVQPLVPYLSTQLKDFWNVYDAINVYRTYGVGNAVPDLSPEQFQDINALATWLEINKMNDALTGNLLGGYLAGDLGRYLDAAVTAVNAQQSQYYKLLSISSHYNTQLGLLAAFQLLRNPASVSALPWLTTQIPQPAAVMVFELHVDSATLASGNGAFAVRLAVQQGSTANYTTVPLPCAVEGDEGEQIAGPGACTYANFVRMKSAAALETPRDWCLACGNTQATVCQLVNAQAQLSAVNATLQQTTAATSSGTGAAKTYSQKDVGLAAGLGVGLTFLATLAICGVAFSAMYRKLKSSQSLVATSPSVSMKFDQFGQSSI